MSEVLKTPVDFRGDGVLWMVNRVVFHPRGFALAYEPESGEFTLWGNGNEPWSFHESMVGTENDAFLSFKALLGRVTDLETEEE